ncbi:16S rRNA (uracil(1498)-N(3))-methyltransferase [Sessilibacter sp. MAH1]
MNLLLLHPADYISEDCVEIYDYRFQHLMTIHKVTKNQTIKVGLINQKVGTGEVCEIYNDKIRLKITLIENSPNETPLNLVLALPRPKMLNRILQTVATVGIKNLVLVNSYKVEKSYWQSPHLSDENIQQQLVLGLEQGKDTILPKVYLKKRFKPFIEDEFNTMNEGRQTFVAHPNTQKACPQNVTEPITLVVGPEGGFIDYEIQLLNKMGCQSINLGTRILKVEQAIPALVYRIFSNSTLGI